MDPTRSPNSARPRSATKRTALNQRQLSSFLLFLSVIILVNLCPFDTTGESSSDESSVGRTISLGGDSLVEGLGGCLRFARLMFTNPMRLSRRTTSFTLAEAKMLGKMAKFWYMKKKIKKLGKKLKKKTIAVPIIAAVPIYEHAHYAHHISHSAHPHGSSMHHAASSLAPTYAQLAAGSELASSESNQRRSVLGGQRSARTSRRIINSYRPSPPVFVDDTAGLYGHYGNAYGRYDGGYHVW